MAYYRKIPVVIEAELYDGNNAHELLLSWIPNGEAFWDDERHAFFIRTLEGDMKASPGDYILRGVEGEYYPCKPSIFDQTYEMVEDVYEILEAIESYRLTDEAMLLEMDLDD